MLKAALWYAKRGWAVLPCEPKGKAPLAKLLLHGCHDATTNADTIRRWWAAYPDANVGIACEPSKLVVADVDTKDGMPGLESWRDLEAAHGASISDTLTVTTPSKGLHVYWARNGQKVRNVDEKDGLLGLGVGVRANGQYVVAPPSRTPAGDYMWDADAAPHERELATLPASLAKLLAPVAKAEPRPVPVRAPREMLGEIEKASAALARLDPKQADGYGTWIEAGMALSELGAAGLALWESWSAQSPKYEPGACAAKWGGFAPGHGVTLGTLYHLAGRNGDTPGAHTPRAAEMAMGALLAADLPEPVWVVPDLLPAGFSILAGRPKQGKSFLALQLAVAFGTGGRFLDRPVPQGKVLYVALEDSPRRLQGRVREMGAPSDASVSFAFSWPALNAEGLDMLEDRVMADGLSLVVVDTLARAIGGRLDWDDVGAVTPLLGGLQQVALARDVCILAIDHHRKPGMVADVVDDIMGSTGKAAVADTIWGLYRKRGDRGAKLRVTGRDVAECELGVVFDGRTLCWQVEETADGVRAGSVQAEILAALAKLGGKATTKELAQALERDARNVSPEIAELVAKRVVVKGERCGREQPYLLAQTSMNDHDDHEYHHDHTSHDDHSLSEGDGFADF